MADFNDILPTGVDIQSMEFISNQATVATQSLSGRQQIRSFGGQYWSARITMAPMPREDLRKVYGFLIKQKGSFNTFTIAPTNLTELSGSALASGEGTDAGALGATSIEADTRNLFQPGDMIKFSGHSKAYMVTVDQGDDDTVFFEPGLVSAVAGSETIRSGDHPTTGFYMTVRLVGDTYSYNVDETGFGVLEFDIVEAV